MSAASWHLLVVFTSIEYMGLTAVVQTRKISSYREIIQWAGQRDYLMGIGKTWWGQCTTPGRWAVRPRWECCECLAVREAEHHPQPCTVGRSLTGEPALCMVNWALGVAVWTTGARGQNPGHHLSSRNCTAGPGGCQGQSPSVLQAAVEGREMCAACSFLSISCSYCSAFAASSTQQLSRISTCFSFFQGKRAHSMCLVQFPRAVSQPQH